jgi:shikimate kinase
MIRLRGCDPGTVADCVPSQSMTESGAAGTVSCDAKGRAAKTPMAAAVMRKIKNWLRGGIRSFRDQSDRNMGFDLRGVEISTKKRPDIGIADQPNTPDDQEIYQQFDQFAHDLPVCFLLCSSIYIWPFGQDHVIQMKMSKIEQTMADDHASAPRYHLKKTAVMVGMMGAGKTAVGRALASKLDVPFLDSDAEIERAANLTVPEIFERDGEAFFRKREAEVISRLLDSERGILSTGGGAFLAEQNRSNISARGVSVWLNADIELLWNRVRHKDTRPLLRTADPRATLTSLFNARVPIYQKADLSVACMPNLTIEQMAERVIDVLLTRPDVLEKTDA